MNKSNVHFYLEVQREARVPIAPFPEAVKPGIHLYGHQNTDTNLKFIFRLLKHDLAGSRGKVLLAGPTDTKQIHFVLAKLPPITLVSMKQLSITRITLKLFNNCEGQVLS